MGEAGSVLEAEAARLCHILLGREGVSPLLNLGSSTREFREVTSPHMARCLFEPLIRSGITVVHCDRKSGDGVDLVGDVMDPGLKHDLKARDFSCVLLANVLEHVRDRRRVAALCEEIVGPGGLILVTVPASYPYHADPIDTYFRPTPEALAQLFGRSRAVLTEEVVGPTYEEEMQVRGSNVVLELVRTLLWLSISFARPRSFASRAHRWRWYSRPYRVAIALLQVTGAASGSARSALPQAS
jgi:hypothetical protein